MQQIKPKNTLGQAIQLLREDIRNNTPNYNIEPIREIIADYQLLLLYMEKGVKDDKRELLYNTLLRKLDKIKADYQLYCWKNNNSAYNKAEVFLKQYQMVTTDDIMEKLQNFASDVALAQEGMASQDNETLYKQYFQFTDFLFNLLWLSPQWDAETTQQYLNIILSPTIHANDAQLLVSAVTLSLINIFDINKFSLLVNVYERADNLILRQKALVGWAIAIHDKVHVYPELQQTLNRLAASKQTLNELLQIQIQIYLCMNAEKDNEEIQRDIMPTIIKNNNLNITPKGITEKEDDQLLDILDPDAEDRAMHEMEQSIQKMIDMQKNGADIYFGGFAHMKNFPFFQQTTNWFRVFDVNHPELNSIKSKIKNKQNTQTTILDILEQNTPLCDSDKYSFLLAMAGFIDQMPENILEAMNASEPFMQPPSFDGEQGEDSQAIVIRRLYLQSLYRFFKIYRYKNDLFNPFQQLEKQHTIFAYTLTNKTLETEDALVQLAKFLYKQKQYKDLQTLLLNNQQTETPQLQSIRASLLIKKQQYRKAVQILETLGTDLTIQQQALLAKAHLFAGNNQQAEEIYQKLISSATNDTTSTILLKWQMNHAQVLIRQNKNEQALKLLYEYNYKNPDNDRILKLLAWALILAKKPQQALQQYNKLKKHKQMADEDLLNEAYAQWMTDNIHEAVILFRQFVNSQHDILEKYQAMQTAFENDKLLFDTYQISEQQQNIMIDLVCQETT